MTMTRKSFEPDSRRSGRRVLIGAAVLLLTAATCVHGQTQSSYADADISEAVSLELLFDQAVPSHRIDVETVDGIVSLTGSVYNLMARERATDLAETVKGVRSVVNRIDVRTPKRPDTEIVEDVVRQLAMNPITESWQISTHCEGGTVIVEGTLDSWQEKQLASRLARSVRGVADVRSEIAVDYEEDRPDSEIQEEVEEAIKWDAYVDGALIEVSVDNGDVRLSGTVGSAAEKNRVVSDAWFAGVRSVDTDDLKVSEWARNERLRSGKYETKADTEVMDAVKDAFIYDPRVNRFGIVVTADSGIVTLSGIVGTLEAKRAAAEDSRNTVGVWRVRNLLAVRPKFLRTDELIANDVIQAINRNPILEHRTINVNVENGLVFLHGNVRTWFEKGWTENIVSGIDGVIEVENNLVVSDPTPLVNNPYVDEWLLVDFNWRPRRGDSTTLDDWEIEQNIERELSWSPFVDGEEVEVTVDDGVADLTGTVETMVERAAAEANAYQGGALSVDNDLVVIYGLPYAR